MNELFLLLLLLSLLLLLLLLLSSLLLLLFLFSFDLILKCYFIWIKYYAIFRLNIIVNNGLRERYFGDLDGKDLIYYNKVWPVDYVSYYQLFLLFALFF